MILNNVLGGTGSAALIAGAISCVVAVLISAYSLSNNASHPKSSVHIFIKLQVIFFSFAILSLAILLQHDAFEYTVVFNAVEKGMSFFTRFSGLWAGQAGSLLFWSWIMSLAALLAIRIAGELEQAGYVLWVSLILCSTLLFFLVPVLFIANPFTKHWVSSTGLITEALLKPTAHSALVPLDGIGMNPALRHPAMLIHPPTLYLGLIGFFIPYAFAMASLILNDNSKTWVRKTQAITIAAWVFLTCGMFLGSWWAYTILGWGGYWGWDAVEISGLLPWLLSFGLLHSTSSWIHSGKSQKWVYGFAISIVILIFFGILLTRSGIIESVHAYTASGIGPALTILILLHLSLGVFLLARKWESIGHLSPPHSNSMKGTILQLFNIGLVLLVLIYLFGQTLPLTSQLFNHTQKSFQPEQYEYYSAPILLVLMILTALYPLTKMKDRQQPNFKMILIALFVISSFPPAYLFATVKLAFLPCLGFFTGIFALLAWVANPLLQWIATRDSSRQPPVFTGSFLIHAGFLIFSLGVLGAENLNTQNDIFLHVGESAEFSGHSIQIQTRQESSSLNGQRVYSLQALVQPWNGNMWTLNPEYRYYPKIDTLTASPDIHSSPIRDVQLIVTDWHRSEDGRTGLGIHIFPLMIWIWAGGTIMILGGIFQLLRRIPKI